jgi:hypothetical protein
MATPWSLRPAAANHLHGLTGTKNTRNDEGLGNTLELRRFQDSDGRGNSVPLESSIPQCF